MPGRPQRPAKQGTDAERDAYVAGRDQFNLVAGLKEPPTPELLPLDPPGFTGREQELARIAELAKGGSVAVVAVDGAAGIGKTALVVHAAHRLRLESGDGQPLFPGGCLYADLRGCDIAGQLAAGPDEVLGKFLRHLGVGGDEMPPGVEERSERLRQLLTSKRALLVLDNAAQEEQVRPLLPGAGASVVLITSRKVLAGLAEVADRIELDVLPRRAAVALLTRLAGPQRAAAEPKAVADVVASCGGLPLALQIAGQLLVSHQQWSVEQLAESLADERHRLDQLAAGDRQVRAAFDVSYRQLRPGEARMFRLLGLYPGSHFDKDIAASLARLGDPTTAAPVLEQLAMAHLITEERRGRFRIHDLLRLFAREACEDNDDDADRTAALEGIASYFTNMAWYLDTCLDPRQRILAEADTGKAGMTLLSQRNALAQFEAERSNLIAVVRFAADQGWHETVWRLSDHMGGALTLLRHLDDLLAVRQAALAAARNAGDKAACGRALGNLGNAYAESRGFAEATGCFEESLATCREIEDRAGESLALVNLGLVYSEQRRFDDAIARYQDALAICAATEDKHCEVLALGNLGNAYQELRRFDEAISRYEAALRISWDITDQRAEGQIRNNLGITYLKLRQFEEAAECFQQDRAICRRLGDLLGEALALGNLGNIHCELRRFDDAIASHQSALVIFRKIGDQYNEGRTLGNLAIVCWQLGQYKNATSYWQDAAQAMRDAGDLEAADRYEHAVSAALSRRRWWHRS
jgi:tetratricopeptide (TPR) repeat protein